MILADGYKCRNMCVFKYVKKERILYKHIVVKIL